jgi:hypothetical protein
MPDSPLPALPAWQARSFWLALIAVAANVAALADFDLFGFFGVDGQEALADNIMQIVGAVAIIWAWFERKSPTRQLSLSGREGIAPLARPVDKG